MTVQSSYSSVSPAIDDWYKTVKDANTAKANIEHAQQQIAALEDQIAAWQSQINQDLHDEAQLLQIIRGFAAGQSLTTLNSQLSQWIAANPGA